MIAALRFFHVVDGMPAWMWVLSLIVGGYGGVLVWIDPAGIDNALGMVLLWQMLCASRGFVRPASAGYFDPILVSQRRFVLAVAHLVHATAAMALVWVAIGHVEIIRGPGVPRAFELGRLSALVFESAAAWAMSLAATRLVTGSLWIGAILLVASTRLGLEQYAAMLAQPEGAAQAVRAYAAAVVCPFLMLGSAMPGRAIVAAGLLGTAAIGVAAGSWFIARRNYALEPVL
jgi:hypothetical protein